MSVRPLIRFYALAALAALAFVLFLSAPQIAWRVGLAPRPTLICPSPDPSPFIGPGGIAASRTYICRDPSVWP